MPDLPFNELGFLFDDNPNPMWVYEIATLCILKVNKAAIDSYGYAEKEFLTLTIRDLRDLADLEQFDKYIDESKPTDSKFKGKARSGTWKHKSKNGKAIYAEVTSHDVKYKNLDCRIVVAADVSDKLRYQEEVKLREQELTGTKNSLEALINNTEDQIWSVDKETRYVYMNQAYRSKITHITGVEPKAGDYSYLHPGYNEQSVKKWTNYYSRALAGEIYAVTDESIDPHTGEIMSFEISFNPIYKDNGEITGVGCFARNITRRLKTEKAMIEQNERLRHIASLTSHELRRPVASMLGLIAIMDRANFYNPDNKEIIEHLLTVGNEIDEVIRLIVDKTFMHNDHLPDKYQSP
jgi:PAS domain S-box-containing protein